MSRRPSVRAALAACALSLLVPATAGADVRPFGALTCVEREGVRWCEGSIPTRVRTFDGVPLDVNVALPLEGDTDLPLVVESHGWGGAKSGFAALRDYARRGYAALGITARGFRDSCGTLPSRLADPEGCARGHIRLDDTRYEIRDVQHLAGLLVDEGLVDPRRIGAIGASYGGGVSLALASLKDRVMLPDGSLAPWTSPKGEPMSLAAAVPWIPWSDLVYSLVPNGRTLDYAITRESDALGTFGIPKTSFISGLFGTGQGTTGGPTGFYAAPGTDPDADLSGWYTRIAAGEPFVDPFAVDLREEIYRHHSSYSIDPSVAPAPTMIASGWTDDLFPADEALRWANRTRRLHPGVPVALMFLDFGHQRGQNKAEDTARFRARANAWLDRHVKGDLAAEVIEGVEVLTQTCPKASPSEGPYSAASWPDLRPGEVRRRFGAGQSFSSAGGDPVVARTIDPIAGGGACATTEAADEPQTANFRLPSPSTGEGFTMIGSPTVVADLDVTGTFPTVAARLWDVAPDGRQTLVARGLFRPGGDGEVVFQLHGNGWRFAPGHTPKLQLLGRDAPYARPSNGQFTVGVRSLDVRLPVRDEPSCAANSLVRPPAAPVVPEGAELAPGVKPTAGASADCGTDARGSASGVRAGASGVRVAGAPR